MCTTEMLPQGSKSVVQQPHKAVGVVYTIPSQKSQYNTMKVLKNMWCVNQHRFVTPQGAVVKQWNEYSIANGAIITAQFNSVISASQ